MEARLKLGRLSFSTTSLDLTLLCYDEKGHLVGILHRVGKGIIPFPAIDFAVEDATENALKQVRQFMKSHI